MIAGDTMRASSRGSNMVAVLNHNAEGYKVDALNHNVYQDSVSESLVLLILNLLINGVL